MQDVMMSPELESLIDVSQENGLEQEIVKQRKLSCRLHHESGYIHGSLSFFAVETSPGSSNVEVSFEITHEMARKVVIFSKFTSIGVFDDDELVFSRPIPDDCEQRYKITPNDKNVLLNFLFKKML